eukprot:5373782-Amphidinium_carterae.1
MGLFLDCYTKFLSIWKLNCYVWDVSFCSGLCERGYLGSSTLAAQNALGHVQLGVRRVLSSCLVQLCLKDGESRSTMGVVLVIGKLFRLGESVYYYRLKRPTSSS